MDNPENNAQLDIVQQRWRDITLPEARRVLLALAEPLSASALISCSARPTAAGAMVATDCGNVYIKRYHASVRDACTIHPYQRYVAWLAGHGMNVMPFLPFDAARIVEPMVVRSRWAHMSTKSARRRRGKTAMPMR